MTIDQMQAELADERAELARLFRREATYRKTEAWKAVRQAWERRSAIRSLENCLRALGIPNP